MTALCELCSKRELELKLEPELKLEQEHSPRAVLGVYHYSVAVIGVCATPPTAPTGRRVDVSCGCNFSFNLIHSRFKVIHLCANMPLSRTLVSRCWASLSGVKGANEWAAPGKLPLCTIHVWVCVCVCCPNLSKSAGVNSPHTPTLDTHTRHTHALSLCTCKFCALANSCAAPHTVHAKCLRPAKNCSFAHPHTHSHSFTHTHTHVCMLNEHPPLEAAARC